MNLTNQSLEIKETYANSSEQFVQNTSNIRISNSIKIPKSRRRNVRLSSYTRRTASFYEIYSFVINGIIISSLVGVGVFGNTLTIIVLSKKCLRSCSSNPYFIALAFWDALLLPCAFTIYTISTLVPPDAHSYRDSPAYGYAVQTTFPVGSIARFSSVWTLIAATLVRFFALCYPYFHNRHNIDQRGLVLIVIVPVIGICFNLVKFFILQVKRSLFCDSPQLRTTKWKYFIQTTHIRWTKEYLVIYHSFLHIIFVTVGPWVLQTILMKLMTYKLRKTDQSQARHSGMLVLNAAAIAKDFGAGISRRDRMNSSPQQVDTMVQSNLRNTTTRILICVNAKFLVCQILPTTLNLLEVIMGKEKFYGLSSIAYAVEISNTCVVANSASNFFIIYHYCVRFREECCRTLLWPWRFSKRLIQHCKGDRTKLFSIQGSIPRIPSKTIFRGQDHTSGTIFQSAGHRVSAGFRRFSNVDRQSMRQSRHMECERSNSKSTIVTFSHTAGSSLANVFDSIRRLSSQFVNFGFGPLTVAIDESPRPHRRNCGAHPENSILLLNEMTSTEPKSNEVTCHADIVQQGSGENARHGCNKGKQLEETNGHVKHQLVDGNSHDDDENFGYGHHPLNSLNSCYSIGTCITMVDNEDAESIDSFYTSNPPVSERLQKKFGSWATCYDSDLELQK